VEPRTVDRLQTGTAAWLENVNVTTAAMRAEDPHTRTKYINYQKELRQEKGEVQCPAA
jgi:hypothetical protein